MKRVISEILRNTRERVRVELDEYAGKQLISARIWFFDKDGELRPTSKGLSVDIRHLSALREAIDQAERIARDAGLI
jgi:hypothetical protein